MNLPQAPDFHPRVAIEVTPSGGIYTPHKHLQPKEAVEKKQSARAAERAFLDEDTLFRSSRHADRIRCWLNSAPVGDAADVILSLVFLDGVCLREELDALFVAINEGRYYQFEQLAFLDGVAVSLGIRRVRLCEVSQALIANAFARGLGDFDSAITLACERASRVARTARVDESTLFSDAKAFISLRYAGWEREWVLGRLFTRVSRPETVIRHYTNLPERSQRVTHEFVRQRAVFESHPYDVLVRSHAARKRSTPTSNKVVLAELTRALADVAEGADRQDLILRALLSRFLVLELAPLTINNYWRAVRPLVDRLVDAGIEIGRPCPDKLAECTCAFLDEYTDDESLDSNSVLVAAVNHLLKVLGSDLRAERIADPASASRRFADFPSSSELEEALRRANTPGLFSSAREMSDARLVLLLLREFSLRRRELRYLRIVDFLLTGDVWLAICHSALGGTKSTSGQRLQKSSAIDLSQALSQRLAVLQEIGLPKQSFIFCDDHEGHKTVGFESIANSVTQLLRSVTGNQAFELHRCRARHVTLEAVNWVTGEMDPLAARQAPTRLAVKNGNGHFRTTAMHYLHEADLVRATRQRQILQSEDLVPSTRFVAALLGVKEDLVRQRRHRGESSEQLIASSANQSPASYRTDLRGFVTDEEARESFPDRQIELSARPICTYSFLRCAGLSADAASFLSYAPIASELQIERVLISPLFANMNIEKLSFEKRKEILRSDLFRVAVECAHYDTIVSISPDLRDLRVVSPDRPWLAKDVRSMLWLVPLLHALTRAGLHVIVKLKVAKGQPDFFTQRKMLHASGIRDVHAFNARHFVRGAGVAVEFVEAKLKSSQRPKSRARCMVIATGVLIAALAQFESAE